MPNSIQLAFAVFATSVALSTDAAGQAPTSRLTQSGSDSLTQQPVESSSAPEADDREVLSKLSSNDPLKLGSVLSKMRETKNLPQSALPRLVELLHDERDGIKFPVLVPAPAPTVGELAGDVLEQYGTKAVRLIEPSLTSDDDDEVLLVLRIISGIGADANRLEKALVNIANSSDSEVVKCAAISAIAAISTVTLKSSKQIIHWLNHESPAVRGIATYEIGNLGNSNEEVVKKVFTLLDDEEMRPFAHAPDARGYRAVKWDAVCALGKITIGNDTVRNRLVKMEQESTRKFEKQIIQKALETMAKNAK